MKSQTSVAMIGPGLSSRGGIGSVVRTLTESPPPNIRFIIIETFVDGSNLKKIQAFIISLFKLIAISFKIDIAHIHHAGGTSSIRKLPLFILMKILNIPVVSHIHTPHLINSSRDTNLAFRVITRFSDRVICLSTDWAASINSVVPRNYDVLPNPVRLNEEFTKKERIILYAGKLENRKGYMDLISVAPFIKGDYKIIFAGNGDLLNAQELCKGLKNVEIVGWQPHNEMKKLFYKSDIFILPSYAEGLPVAVIEALASRCCVITTPVGSIPELLTHGVNCFLFEPGDLDAMTSAINHAIDDNINRLKVSNSGYELAVKTFCVDSVLERLCILYDEIIRT